MFYVEDKSNFAKTMSSSESVSKPAVSKPCRIFGRHGHFSTWAAMSKKYGNVEFLSKKPLEADEVV
jgi:hypothetical protein